MWLWVLPIPYPCVEDDGFNYMKRDIVHYTVEICFILLGVLIDTSGYDGYFRINSMLLYLFP